jgi:hypothetical protein
MVFREHIFVFAALLLFIPLVTFSQENAPIRGHQLGETILDYLKAEPNGMRHLAFCRQALEDRKFSRRRSAEVKDCRALVSAVDDLRPWRSELRQETSSGRKEVIEFNGGRVISMSLYVPKSTFSMEDVMLSLHRRYGRPTADSQMIGGMVDDEGVYEWNLASVYVRAEKTASENGNSIHVLIMLPDEYDRQTGKGVLKDDPLQ